MAEFEIETDDLSADALLQKVAAEHEGVREHLDDYETATETASAAESAAEELDLDDPSDLAEHVGVLTDELDELRSYKSERESEEMREHAEAIAERTDRFGEDADEVMEAHDSLEDIESTHELVDDLTETVDEKTANAGGESTDSPERPQKYAKTPW